MMRRGLATGKRLMLLHPITEEHCTPHTCTETSPLAVIRRSGPRQIFMLNTGVTIGGPTLSEIK